MRQRANKGGGVGARLALALAPLSFFALLGAVGSCATEPDSTPGRRGKPCKGPEDCDEKTYCQADDGNCGPGTCVARPTKNERALPYAALCGCDGKAYGSYNRAWMHGVDVGLNHRCLAQNPTLFPCGEEGLCGCVPDGQLGDPCVPGGQIGYWNDVCVEEDNQYFCSSQDFIVHGCDDPSNEFIALCNGCIDAELSSCPGVTYGHYTCATKGEGLYLTCW